jgi:hypothetical protein
MLKHRYTPAVAVGTVEYVNAAERIAKFFPEPYGLLRIKPVAVDVLISVTVAPD